MNGTMALNKLTAVASASSAVIGRITGPLRKICTFSLADESIYPAKTLSVSLEKGSLPIVYGTRFLSRIKIQGVREYSCEEGRYPQPEFFASSIVLAINDLGAAKASISLSIPKEWTIIKETELPLTVKDNLSDVISYELDRITPFSPEDAFFDFKVLGEDTGKLSVLVAAAKTEIIRPYIDALKEKGLTINRLTLDLSGFETLCRHIGGEKDRIFIEIGKEGYEGALFLNGSITGAFSGTFSSEEEQSRIDTIIMEIAPLTTLIESREKSPQIMVLLKDKRPTLKELLKIRLDRPVEILNETDIKIRLAAGTYKTIPYGAVGGVMESLLFRAKSLNLLTKGRHERFKSPKGLTFILGIVILAMWLLYFIAPLKIEEQRLQEIDRQIMLRKEEVKKVEALQKEMDAQDKEIATIKDFKGNRPMALSILKDLTSILPKNAWLSRVRITQTTVELEGYASSATGILAKLEASPYFKKSEFSSPTFRDTRMNADRFNIKMEIEGVQDIQKGKGADEEE
jgi:general secretion pathway protein L